LQCEIRIAVPEKSGEAIQHAAVKNLEARFRPRGAVA
jgi:hypothetical protein